MADVRCRHDVVVVEEVRQPIPQHGENCHQVFNHLQQGRSTMC